MQLQKIPKTFNRQIRHLPLALTRTLLRAQIFKISPVFKIERGVVSEELAHVRLLKEGDLLDGFVQVSDEDVFGFVLVIADKVVD